VRNSPENAAKVYRALANFGAPLQKDGLSPDDFAGKDLTYQIGVEPVRIDVLTHITGVEFSDAWRNRVASVMFGVPVYVISRGDLIANKRAAGRPSDTEQLESLLRERSGSSSQ
jgi:hypothetical protein